MIMLFVRTTLVMQYLVKLQTHSARSRCPCSRGGSRSVPSRDGMTYPAGRSSAGHSPDRMSLADILTHTQKKT